VPEGARDSGDDPRNVYRRVSQSAHVPHGINEPGYRTHSAVWGQYGEVCAAEEQRRLFRAAGYPTEADKIVMRFACAMTSRRRLASVSFHAAM
jgi:hypothetical protein